LVTKIILLIRKLLEVSELEQELVSGGDHPTMLKQVYQGDGILHERLFDKPKPTLA
jgi:hypothetical protein